MPRKTVSKRRTRFKSRAKCDNRRTTRKRRGGECGDINAHGDYENCVKAGCDARECAKIHKAYVSPINPVEQTLFNTFISSLDRLTKELIATEPKYQNHQYLSAINMPHDKLAKEFEEYCFYNLPPHVQRTITDEMRKASVNQYKSIMPRLLKNYDAVGHRECGDINAHGDYENCVKAGCNKRMCTTIYVDPVNALALTMGNLEFNGKTTPLDHAVASSLTAKQKNLLARQDWRSFIADFDKQNGTQ